MKTTNKFINGASTIKNIEDFKSRSMTAIKHRDVMRAIEDSIEQLGGMPKNAHTPPFTDSAN